MFYISFIYEQYLSLKKQRVESDTQNDPTPGNQDQDSEEGSMNIPWKNINLIFTWGRL